MQQDGFASPDDTKVMEALDRITDLYLPMHDALDGFFYPKAVSVRSFPFLFDFATELLERCKERIRPGELEFVVRCRGISYRGHVIDTIEQPYLSLRRMPRSVPTTEALGLDPAIRKVLMHESMNKGGLVLICGETGQGKSTTCAAVIKERMVKYGAFCLTVEDPPEMPLHGQHGDGRCLQTEVAAGRFDEALRGAMRCYPTANGSILYVGETRGAETAAEVLRAAMNGALVFTTTHASDVPAALRRISSFAATRMSKDEADSILAAVFRVGIHQTLEEVRPLPGQPARRKLSASFLLSPSAKTPVANKIRKGELDALGTDLQQQKAILTNQGPAALLKAWE